MSLARCVVSKVLQRICDFHTSNVVILDRVYDNIEVEKCYVLIVHITEIVKCNLRSSKVIRYLVSSLCFYSSRRFINCTHNRQE